MNKNKNRAETMEYIIEKLTELLIKQEFEDRKKKAHTYVKKTRCYKDLIKFFKEQKELY